MMDNARNDIHIFFEEFTGLMLNTSSTPAGAVDDYGDETELEIIIAKGQQEAEEFGERARLSFGEVFHPAKWLNPPRKVTDE